MEYKRASIVECSAVQYRTKHTHIIAAYGTTILQDNALIHYSFH